MCRVWIFGLVPEVEVRIWAEDLEFRFVEGRDVECADPLVVFLFPLEGELGRRVEDATDVLRLEDGDWGESE